MGRKIVRETNHINYETGEIKSSVQVYSRKDNREYFIMLRLTDGIDYLDNFKNIKQIKLLITIAKSVNSEGFFYSNSLFVKKFASKNKCSTVYIHKLIKYLIDNDFLKRMQRGVYMVNPKYFFKGLLISTA